MYQTERFRIANEYCSIIIEKFGDIYYYFNLVSRESDCLGLYVSKGLSKYINPTLDTLNLENFDRSCKPSVITAINGEAKWVNLQLHPTISSNQITVTGIENTPITHYSIVSVNGFITQEKFTNANINVGHLTNGMYLLNLYNEQGLLQTLKFVKE